MGKVDRKQQFIDKAISKYGNDRYDYSNVIYTNSHEPVEIICNKCGATFESKPMVFLRATAKGCVTCQRKERRNKEIQANTIAFIDKANKKHNSETIKYKYDDIEYVNTSTKVKIWCCTCNEYFMQTPQDHLVNNGCRKCGILSRSEKKTRTTDEFITKARAIHGNLYDYSKVVYVKGTVPVTIIDPVYGEFEQTPGAHLQGHGNPSRGYDTVIDKHTKQTFIKEASEIHGNKFDYTDTMYTNSHVKIDIKCNICNNTFSIRPYAHLLAKHKDGCPACCHKANGLRSRLTTEEFIERSISIHGDKYDYSCTVYKTSDDKVSIKCKECDDIFEQIAWVHLSGCGCSKCNISKQEKEVLNYISSIYTGKILSNDRTILKPKELDILLPELNIAVEFNGNYWHSDANNTPPSYHVNKTNNCEAKGIQLIHIFQDEWEYKQDIVKARLKHIITNNSERIYARKCSIAELDSSTCNNFLDTYHIQGKCSAGVKLGLYYQDILVAVMTFGKTRFSSDYEWELIRYATVSDSIIIGGASKLLKYFERNYNPSSIISYADRRWSKGNLYSQLGFTHLRNSQPNFFYMASNSIIRESRIKYQKHKLEGLYNKGKLSFYSSQMSERLNMQMNEYCRIHDSGNMVFIKHY